MEGSGSTRVDFGHSGAYNTPPPFVDPAQRAMNRLLTLPILLATSASLAIAQDSLPRDPSNVYGQFDNGVSYIVRKNANPPGRFSAFLHIRAGALHETAEQNGIAHFLEHMAFNGSKHYPPGTLVPALNELGMEFGADSNAHTGLDETVYKLHMPENDAKMLERAFVILGDVAHGLLLPKEEIEKERDVILEEKRAHKGVEQRVGEWVRGKLFANSRIAVHDVIGPEEGIRGFTREQFVDFYDTWYRPERMTLIVVGDIEPDAVVAAAKPHLGEFEARAKSREYLGAKLSPFESPTAAVYTDPDVVQATVQLIHVKAGGVPPQTKAQYEAELMQQVATGLLNRRLGDLVQKGEAQYLGAGAAVSNMLGEVEQPGIYAGGDAGKWMLILEQLLGEARRVLDHGFNDRELDLVRRDTIAQLEHAVRTEASRESQGIVSQISSAVGTKAPLLSAAQRLALAEAAFGKMSVADLKREFRKAFDTRDYAYVLVLPATGVEIPEDETVVDAANVAWGRETEALEESSDSAGLLTKLPTPGNVRAQRKHEGLGVTTTEFENGVVAHHRFMDYRKGSVMLLARVPGGAIHESGDSIGRSQAASLIGATSRLSSLEIRDLMAGKNVEFQLDVGNDAITIMVGGAPDDLEAGLQWMYACVTDGIVEETGLDTWQQAQHQQLDRAKTDLNAQFGMALNSAILGDDPRFAPPTAETIDRQTTADAAKWFRELFDGSPVELAVVGDMEEARATELVARYFGSLPEATRGFDWIDADKKLDLPEGAQKKRVEVATPTPQAIVLSGFRGCDRDQEDDRRLLGLAALVLTDRMRVEIREERGLVYSIQCSNQPGGELPGTGIVFAAAPTDPAKSQELIDALFALMVKFAEEGPTAEEFENARLQAKTQIEQVVKQPGFWANVLSSVTSRGRSLDELVSLERTFEKYTAEQVRDVARKYFKDDRRITVVAVPK